MKKFTIQCLDNSQDYLCGITNKEFELLQANHLFRETFGIAHHEYIGKPLTDTIQLISLEKCFEAGEACLQQPGKVINIDVHTRLNETEEKWFSWEISAVTDEDNCVLGVRFLGTDITKQKSNEQTLLYQAALLDHISDAVISTNDQFVIKTINRAAEEIYGIPRQDVCGKPISNVVEYKYLNDTTTNAKTVLLSEGIWKGEVEYQRKDGEVFYLEAIVSAVKNTDGQVIGYVAVNRNITQRKKAETALLENEARLIDLTQNVPGVIYQWKEKFDGTYGFTYISPKLKEYFGFAPDEMHKMSDIMHPDDKARWRATIEAANKNETPWIFEGRLLYPGGKIKWYQATSAISVKNEEGRVYNGILTDITLFKEAEATSNDNQQRFRAIFNSMYQFIGLMQPDGILLDVNDTFIRFSGLNANNLIGKYMWDCLWFPMSPVEVEYLKISIEMAARGEFVRYEYEIYDKEGQPILIDFSIMPVKNEKGEVVYLIPEGRDITPKRIAEKKLGEAQEEFRLFMKNTPALSWITDENGVMRYMNPRYLETCQLGEEHVGKNMFDLFPKDLVCSYLENNRIVLETNSPIETIEEGVKQGNIKAIYRVFKFPMGEKNGLRLIGGTSIDITDYINTRDELSRSHERYDFASKATSDAIWDWEMGGNKIYRGEGFSKLFGLEDNIASFDLSLIHVHPDDRKRVKESLEAAINGNDNRWQMEYRFKHALGHYKIVKDKAYILRNADKTPVRIIGAMQDITAQRDLENKLAAEEAQKKREIITAIITAQENERKEISYELHDNVNQILATCKLFLETARQMPDKYLHLIDECAVYIQNVIDEIRVISRSLTPYALADLGLLAAIEDVIEKINGSGKIDIRFEQGNVDDHQKISMDVKMTIFRIIQEQVTNVLKHAQAGKLIISLSINKGNAYLQLADNGKGFDKDSLRKGIGLHNIQNRVEYYKGTVDINTTPGNGCTLIIHLPYE